MSSHSASLVRAHRPSVMRSTHTGWVWLALGTVLVACGGNDRGAPTLEEVDGLAPERVEVLSTVRSDGVELKARVVNSYRVAVPGGELQVSAEGANVEGGAATETLDTRLTGVASTILPATGAGAATVQVLGSELPLDLNDGVGSAWTIGVPMSDFAIATGSMLGSNTMEPSFSEGGTNGVAVAIEDEVWWNSAVPGMPAHRVADMPQNVAGMVSGHIDRDGILDLAVWSGNQVILLRGLTDGGYSWGSGWRAVDGDIVGVSIDDADSDRISDISIGTSGEGSGVVTVFKHDGSWAFEAYPELVVNSELYSIAVGDEAGDGRPDVSVFATVTGSVRRYTLAEEGWVGAPTSELPNYESFDGGRLLPLADLDGDGVLETIIQDSPDANSQKLLFYIIDPSGQGTVNYPLEYGLFEAAVADVDLNGNSDIVLVEDGRLVVVSWNVAEGNFGTSASLGADLRGPLAVADVTGDGLPDVTVATDYVRFHHGAINEEGLWTRNAFGWTTYPTSFHPSVQVADLNGDGVDDFVGLQVDPDTGDVDVVAWELDFGVVVPEVDQLGSVQLVTSGVAHDLVVCDGEVYALAEGVDDDTATTSAEIRLSRIRFSASTGATVESEVTLDRGVMMDCGTIGNGNPGVVVASQTGFWKSYSRALAEVGSGDVGTTDDIALADVNGDGLGDVIGCAGDGDSCSVLGIDLDGDGVAEIVQSSLNTTVFSASGDTTLYGRGDLSAADVDGDGRTDVFGWDAETGILSVWRNVGGALAPAVVLHASPGMQAVAGLADMTGDGVPELVFVDETGGTRHASATVPAEGAAW